ncbi:MAG: type III secretion system chaperone [Pseudomonadota bacterium]
MDEDMAMADASDVPAERSRIERQTVLEFLARLSLNLGDHCDRDEDGAITFTFDEGRELSLFHVEETGQLVCEIEIALVEALEDRQLSDLLALNMAADWTGTGVLAIGGAGETVVYITSIVVQENDAQSLDAAIGSVMTAAGMLSSLLEPSTGARASADPAPMSIA